jgi:hypothetical protein
MDELGERALGPPQAPAPPGEGATPLIDTPLPLYMPRGSDLMTGTGPEA